MRLEVQSVHQHWMTNPVITARDGGVYGNAGTSWKVTLLTSPVVGGHSMVPEDRELVWQDHSSPVGSAGSGLVGISSSPARSSPRYSGNGSHALHRCTQLGLGSPTRLTLDKGTVVSISKIVAHKRYGDADHHQRCERLPTSSEVQSGSIDVRQRSHGCLHQERRGHTILHFHAADDTPAEVVWSQGDQAGASPSARIAQLPGRCTVQNQPDSQHRVDVVHGASSTRVCPVGRTTDQHVCYIHQQMTDQVCIALSGPQDRVDECDVHFLGQREGLTVCVPAIQVGPSGSAEDLPVSRGTNDSGSSHARNNFLVPGAFGVGWRGGVGGGRRNPSLPFVGHLSGKGTFTGSCWYDVKIPTSVIATSVWIALGTLCPLL